MCGEIGGGRRNFEVQREILSLSIEPLHAQTLHHLIYTAIIWPACLQTQPCPQTPRSFQRTQTPMVALCIRRLIHAGGFASVVPLLHPICHCIRTYMYLHASYSMFNFKQVVQARTLQGHVRIKEGVQDIDYVNSMCKWKCCTICGQPIVHVTFPKKPNHNNVKPIIVHA